MRQHSYTIRAASGRPDDYEVCCDGNVVGRCYHVPFAAPRGQWSWTVYFGVHVKRTVEGVEMLGRSATLDGAQIAFRESFERLLAEQVVYLPTRSDV
jgi:hypothetical protein